MEQLAQQIKWIDAALNTTAAPWWKFRLARWFGERVDGEDGKHKCTGYKWRGIMYMTDYRIGGFKMKKHQRREAAWGVHLGLTDFDKRMLREGRSKFKGHGLLGGHYINVGGLWCDGSQIALYSTRAKARERVKVVRDNWPTAKAVKVEIKMKYVA